MTDSIICTGKEETIFQCLDGDLPPAERAAFERHLAQCETCRALLAETETLFAEFAALNDIPAPVAEITAGVMANLPRETAPSPIEQWFPAAQLAVGLALLALSLPKLWNGLAWTFNLPQWTLPAIPWALLAQRVNLPAGWLTQWAAHLSAQWDGAFLPISPTLAFAALGLLGLAWLVSNSLLLNPKQSHSLKNGGTS